jgi:hypothetical protein
MNKEEGQESPHPLRVIALVERARSRVERALKTYSLSSPTNPPDFWIAMQAMAAELIADIERHRAQQAVEAELRSGEMCPEGHVGPHRLLHEETGSVERCLQCNACAATYILIKGRWYSSGAEKETHPSDRRTGID